jgi:hypothetical protein
MSLQEVKQEAIKYVQDTVTPLYIAHEVRDASFEEVQKLDSNGKWEEAANQLFTLARHSEIGSPNRAKSLVLLSQQLINKGKFRLAEDCLATLESEVDQLPSTNKIIVSAQIHEKRAWIADHLGDPDSEIDHLEKARNYIDQLSEGISEQDAKARDELLLTANHFIGRACITKAKHEPNKKQYWVGRAMNNFASGIADLDLLSTDIEPRHANIGFQYAQMAYAMMVMGNLDRAEQFIDTAGEYFYLHSMQYPDSGIMAQQETLRGLLYAAKSERSYRNVLDIRYEKERYPAGEARAHAGIAAAALAQGKVDEFMRHTVAVFKTSPQIVLQG